MAGCIDLLVVCHPLLQMLVQFWRWWASHRRTGQQRRSFLKNFKFSRCCTQYSCTHKSMNTISLLRVLLCERRWQPSTDCQMTTQVILHGKGDSSVKYSSCPLFYELCNERQLNNLIFCFQLNSSLSNECLTFCRFPLPSSAWRCLLNRFGLILTQFLPTLFLYHHFCMLSSFIRTTHI